MVVNRIMIAHILSLCVGGVNGYIALPSHHVSKNFLKTSPPSSPSRSSTQLLHSMYQNHPHWPDDAFPSEDYSNNNPVFFNDFDDLILELEEGQFWETTTPIIAEQSSIPSDLRPTRTSDTTISDFLNARISQVTKDSRQLLKNWRKGHAESFGAFTINEQYLLNKEQNKEDDPDSVPFDWVRRVDVGQYPRVACGSAHGSIFVADAMSKQVMGVARGVHYSEHSDEYANALDEQLRQCIYGEYDGGGVLDVAMFGKNVVASAGREGGVKLFKLLEDGNQAELIPQGDVKALLGLLHGVSPLVVTCMKFDSYGRLHLGCSDGFLRIVSFPQDFIFGDGFELNPDEVHVTVVPHWSDQAPSPILSIDVSEELEMVVTSHVNGNVCLYSMKEHEDVYNMASGRREHVGVIGVWNPFTADKSYARSVTFTSKDSMQGPKYAVVVGGGNGEVWVNDIYPEYEESKTGEVFVDKYVQKFEPNHVGPVISLCSRPEGLIVSVGHDGMLRMTQTWIGLKEVKNATPVPLYGLGGYKAWIGSVCVDDEGKRLISDGMDDAVIVHDFSEYEKEENSQ